MVLENKLGLNNSAELANAEEKITKLKAKELYDTGFINKIEVGTFIGLAEIHKYLFDDIYEFAGKIREVNIAKGGFRFAPVIYLKPALEHIDQMPQSDFSEIVEKYVEMNVAHPFREGNGRTGRILISYLLVKNELSPLVIEAKDKEAYINFLNTDDVDGFYDFAVDVLEREEKRISQFQNKESLT